MHAANAATDQNLWRTPVYYINLEPPRVEQFENLHHGAKTG